MRVEGVREPGELLISVEKPFVHTKQAEALARVVESIKAGNETASLPAIDAFIAEYPQVGDAYPVRAALRCATQNFEGARADVEKALSGVPRILPHDFSSNRNELLALHAKLAFLAHDDAATSHDLHEIINAYSSDIRFLTDGRVKLTDKAGDELCGWTPEDVEQWLERSRNAPEAQVFRGMFTASFAPLDDDAKALTSRYAEEAIQANPSFAPAYFYAAVGL